MDISSTAYWMLTRGGLTLAACCAVALFVTQRAPSNVPEAKVAGAAADTRRSRRRLARLALWPLMVAALALAGLAWRSHHDVVYVADGAAGPRVTRYVHLGDVPYRSSSAVYTGKRRSTWIVNRSSEPLRFQSLGYGDARSFAPETIAPGAELPVDTVDHVGPSAVPPTSVTVTSRQHAGQEIPHFESRGWLTWGPPPESP